MKKTLLVLVFVFLIQIVIAASPSFDEGLPADGATLYEDTPVYYDINASDAEDGDESSGNLTYSDDTALFDIGTDNGTISFTPTNSDVGVYNATFNNSVAIIVKDTDEDAAIDIWTFEIVEVNDAPVIDTTSLADATEGEYYTATIDASDEENHIPFEFAANESFVNFTNLTDTSGLIAFTPTNDHVGTWTINFSAYDFNGSTSKNGSRLLTLTINNANDFPTWDYVCNDYLEPNETFSGTEEQEMTCEINASDIDAGETLTFSANETWFTMNASGYLNFTPDDAQTGNWTINLTVEDSAGAQNTTTLNLSIERVNDTPTLDPIGAQLLFVDVWYYYDVNATDGDKNESIGDNLTFSINDTTLFEINETNGTIWFLPASNGSGENWLNISVNDSYGLIDSEQVNFTIISNTAPYFNHTEDNLSATEDSEFYYDLGLNVTDDENDNLTFTDNSSLFIIGLNNGTISFTANDSFVGDNFVNITVTDQPGSINSTIINFSVANVEDNPVLDLIGNWTVNEDAEFYNDTSASDEDLNIPETSEYLRFSDNTTLFDIDAVSGEINWTPNSSQVGMHTINISVNDSAGNIDYEIINITVYFVNDNPVIIGDLNLIANEDVLFIYDFNATDEEDDPLGVENGSLTFAENTTLFEINETNGTILWTPNSSQVGTYWINLTVNDTQGASSSEIINITVYGTNDAPVINDDTTTPTGGEGGVEENDSLTLTVYVDDIDGDGLAYNWTVDGLQNQTSSDVGALTTQSDSFVYAPNFTDEGEHNITVVVSDSTATDAHSWNITVNNTNAPPTFTGEIENISVSGSSATSTTIELSDYFADIDYGDTRYNQSVSFNWSQMNESNGLLESSTFNVSVNNNTWTATISSASTSFEIVGFVMNDTDYNVYSNNFSVNFTITPEAVAPTSGGGGGGGGGGAKTYVAIDIIHPGDISLIVGEQIVTPLIIKNTGDLTLNSIGLEASSPSSDIGLSLSKTSIPFLAKGQEETVDLVITTSNSTLEGKKEIIVRAPVGSPSVTDSVKFFVSLIEFGLEDKKLVKEKIVYLKDLVNENPECLELQEVISKAEDLMNAEEFEESTKLTSQAIQACKDLVASVGAKKVELPLVRIAGDNIYLIIAEFIALVAIIWFIYRYLRKRKRKKMLK